MVVLHDARQCFEHRFGLEVAAATALGDAAAPGPARIGEVRRLVREREVACVPAEPQFDAGLVATVAEGTGARTAVADPLGAELEPGPDLHPDLIRAVARAVAACA